MKLTLVLNNPPKFHFWRDFGAGKKRRIPFYKHWWNIWRREIMRKKLIDNTLSIEQLPPGSRILDAEDFMKGPLDLLPNEIFKQKEEKIIYDHPWPFNVKLDPIKNQELMHCYDIHTRFFVPKDDCLALTNTVLGSQLEAKPLIEPTDNHIETMKRQYEWATKGDSVMVRLPRKRSYPKINLDPRNTFGITKERQETNFLNSLFDYSQILLAQHLHQKGETERLEELLNRRSIAFPHCQVPFERQERKFNLSLCIDSLSISDKPMSQINPNPEATKAMGAISIHPRTWKSTLEQSRNYKPDWSFTLPRNSHLHTIQLASRIKRDHRDSNEMLARSMIHAFGITSQYARLRTYEKQLLENTEESKLASIVLQDPLRVSGIHDKDSLDQPIVLQTIGLDLLQGDFHFMRYQLNTLKFEDTNEGRVKNQAWYSGPIYDFREVLRFYLDFQAFDSNTSSQMLELEHNEKELVNNQSL